MHASRGTKATVAGLYTLHPNPCQAFAETETTAAKPGYAGQWFGFVLEASSVEQQVHAPPRGIQRPLMHNDTREIVRNICVPN
jgi:hypothetical protein